MAVSNKSLAQNLLNYILPPVACVPISTCGPIVIILLTGGWARRRCSARPSFGVKKSIRNVAEITHFHWCQGIFITGQRTVSYGIRIARSRHGIWEIVQCVSFAGWRRTHAEAPVLETSASAVCTVCARPRVNHIRIDGCNNDQKLLTSICQLFQISMLPFLQVEIRRVPRMSVNTLPSELPRKPPLGRRLQPHCGRSGSKRLR